MQGSSAYRKASSDTEKQQEIK